MSVPVSPSRATQIAARTPTAPQLEGLARGSRGPDVMSLQRSLNARGANLDVDGKFGPLTEAALKSFQATSGCGGNGRVNGDSAKLLSQAPTTTTKPTAEAAATTTAATTKPAAEATTDSISAGGTCAAPTAVPLPTAAASTAAAAAVDGPAPAGVSLAPAQVKTAIENIELGRTQARQEKEVLGEMRGALQREIKELETPLAGSASSASSASVADEAVLMGRRGQLDAVGKADELVDLKLKGFDAAEIAVKDGVLTEVEAKALTDVDTAYKTSEGAIANQMSSASSLVDKGIQAGGRGRPVLGLRKKAEEAASTTGTPTTTTTTAPATTATTATTAATKPAGTAIASADVKQALSNIDAAKTAAKVELEAVGTARKGIQAEAYSLQGLTNKTPADQAVLDGRLAQLKVLDGAKENIELRIAGLDAAGKAVSDGVLTDDEASNLAKIDAGVTGGQQILSAQASMASEMIRMGLNAGGRGSAEALF